MKYVELKNNLGMVVTLCTTGAGLYDITAPDKNGVYESVLCTPTKEHYPNAIGFNGKICGRTAGRISNHSFVLNDVKYDLDAGLSEKHCLHGGIETLAKKEFLCSLFEDNKMTEAMFTYISLDMEGGYPGNLKVTVVYQLMKDENVLKLKIKYKSDKDTICNLTNHVYFNLSGNVKRNVLDEILTIDADKVGLVDSEGICYEIGDTIGSLDMKTPHSLGAYITDTRLNARFGYDNPFVLNDKTLKASLYDKESGRLLNMYSTYDCLVVYTDNYPEKMVLPNGNDHKIYDSVALEFQHFPNSINSDFIKDKKDICYKDKEYVEETTFEFLTK